MGNKNEMFLVRLSGAGTLRGDAPGVLALDESAFTPSATTGGSDPSDDTFEISVTGPDADYTVAVGEAWCSVDIASGTVEEGSPDTITVSYDITGLAADEYTDTITVASGDVSNSPQTISVTLTVGAYEIIEDFDAMTPAANVIADADWSKDAGWGAFTHEYIVKNLAGADNYCDNLRADLGGARARWDAPTRHTTGVVDVFVNHEQTGGQLLNGFYVGNDALDEGILFMQNCITSPKFRLQGFGFGDDFITDLTAVPTTGTIYWLHAQLDFPNKTIRANTWTGAIGDEPGTWDVEEVVTVMPPAGDVILHSGTDTYNPTNHQVYYLKYTWNGVT